MSIDVESRTAAALEAWASTVTPTRPSLDELLAKNASPVVAEARWARVRWLAAAAAALVAVVGGVAVVAATRHRSESRQDPPPISQASVPPSSTSTTIAAEESPSGLFAPLSVPLGYRVFGADAWVPSPLEVPVTVESWTRRDASGVVADRLGLQAILARSNWPPTGMPGDALVHGQPATLSAPSDQATTGPTVVMWSEAGLQVSLSSTAADVDVLALAERTEVTQDGVRLPDDALPAGFKQEVRSADPAPAEVASQVSFASDDASKFLSLTATPDVAGLGIEWLLSPDAQIRIVDGRQVGIEASAPGFVSATWIEDGSILLASGPDEATLLAFVDSVGPTDRASFDVFVDQATASTASIAEQDSAVFPDGLRVSLHAPSLEVVGDTVPPNAAICVDGDRVRCGNRTGHWSGAGAGLILQQADALVAVDAQTEQVIWVHHPASEIRRITDPASGAPIPFEAIPGAHGVFVRIDVPADVAVADVSVWFGDGDRSVGGSGMGTQLDIGRRPEVVTVTTTGVEAPQTTGWFLPGYTPDGFALTAVEATAADLSAHDPISQDYWVRRGLDGIVTDWLSLTAVHDPDGSIPAADANLTINDLPATLRTDAAGLTTITWIESQQRVTAASTIDSLELASAIDYVSVDTQGGGALLVTPARFEHIDRTAAIVAANPLAVSTNIRLENDGGATLTIATTPNVDGQSFETRPPQGTDTYASVGADNARITHRIDEPSTTTVEWVSNGYLIEITATNIDDQTLLAVAASIQPVDSASFEEMAATVPGN